MDGGTNSQVKHMLLQFWLRRLVIDTLLYAFLGFLLQPRKKRIPCEICRGISKFYLLVEDIDFSQPSTQCKNSLVNCMKSPVSLIVQEIQ